MGETRRFRIIARREPVEKSVDDCCLYWPLAPSATAGGRVSFDLCHREADLPAQRSTPQAQARLSHADVDARRTADPEAAPAEGPRAAFGVTFGT